MELFYVDKGKVEEARGPLGYTMEQVVESGSGSTAIIYKCFKEGCTPKVIKRIAAKLKVDPWWKLLIQDQRVDFENGRLRDVDQTASLLLFHRTTDIGERLYLRAFASEKNVYYVTTMSGGQSFEMIREQLTARTTVHALTWMPESVAEVNAFAVHLNEGADKTEQIAETLRAWDSLVREHENIKLRTYSSSPPMMYGVAVEDVWVHLELLTYKTDVNSRAALLLHSDNDSQRQALRFFSGKMKELYRDGKKRVPGEMPT